MGNATSTSSFGPAFVTAHAVAAASMPTSDGTPASTATSRRDGMHAVGWKPSKPSRAITRCVIVANSSIVTAAAKRGCRKTPRHLALVTGSGQDLHNAAGDGPWVATFIDTSPGFIALDLQRQLLPNWTDGDRHDHLAVVADMIGNVVSQVILLRKLDKVSGPYTKGTSLTFAAQPMGNYGKASRAPGKMFHRRNEHRKTLSIKQPMLCIKLRIVSQEVAGAATGSR